MLAQMTGGGWGALDWSPDDKQILILEEISANETYLWLMDSSTGDKTLLTAKGGAEKIAYANAKFSKDGKGIYLTTDKDSEFQRLAYLDLSSKKYTFLTEHIHWDVEDFDITPDGKTIAFTTNEDGFGILHLLDTKTGKEKPAPKLPAGLHFRRQVAPQRPRSRLRSYRLAFSVRCVFRGCHHRKSGSLDQQRNRRLESSKLSPKRNWCTGKRSTENPSADSSIVRPRVSPASVP